MVPGNSASEVRVCDRCFLNLLEGERRRSRSDVRGELGDGLGGGAGGGAATPEKKDEPPPPTPRELMMQGKLLRDWVCVDRLRCGVV